MAKIRKDGRSTMTVSRTTTAIIHGKEDLGAWTEEELLRGQRRSPKTGRWLGKRPKIVPTAVHDELVKRKLSAAFALLRDNLVAAVETLAEIAKDKNADPHARIKAAVEIVNRVGGKPPERVMLGVGALDEPKWLQAITAGIVSISDDEKEDEAPALPPGDDDVIDAEFVDDVIIPDTPPTRDPRKLNSRDEQLIEPSLPRVVSIQREPKTAPSVRERRLGLDENG